MSRSSHQRQQQKLQLQQQQQQLLAQQQQIADNEAAAAGVEMFDLFCVATTMRQILGLHRNMCDVIGMRPAPLNEFYPKLKQKVRSWKAQALWKKFDARSAHRVYGKGAICTGTRVLVIGAGPCGLRTAIEAQLLGAKVVLVEKRDRISRNNVLHLWPFVITDLRNLGAKKFYGKFCAGSIDHISIRQLQCILLKVALLLGVEIHEGVSFERTIEPSDDGCGWRAAVTPSDHAVSHYEFDVLIGADGKRNTLEGFRRKEFRGKLAIAITANFINKKTEAEAKAEEISGVAFIFNQSFFKELYHTTGIDLENIVYYKDETHYFVMTAKKHSLIDKGVIIQDFADPAELLASANVNTEKLLDYAREAAEFSTKYQMPNLEFAVNHFGKPDVAMFDFTSMFAAENSSRVIVRKGFRLLQCLVGDSLLEPFWPTGSGCARGFLSSMDAAYAIRLWSNSRNSTLGVLAQRESIYRLLNQTTPENLQRDIGSYTVDPATRYPNLNRTSVNVWQVKHLIDADDKAILEQTFMDTNTATQVDTPLRRKRRSGDSMPLSAVLLRWVCAQLNSYDFTKNLKEPSDIFTNGKVLCALIFRYRPDLVDFNTIKDYSVSEANDLAFKILEKELQIPRIMTGKESIQLNTVDSKLWLNYLEQVCEVFRGEIPHIKHPKIDFSELREKYRFNNTHAQPDFSKLLQISSKHKAKSPMQDLVDVPQVIQRRSLLDEEKLKRQRRHEQLLASGGAAGGAVSGTGQQAQTDTTRRGKKRRSAEKTANIEERQKRLEEIEQNRQDRQSKRRQQRYQQTQNFYKSLHMLHANILLRESDESSPFEDYSIFLYRQQAPEFNDRVKELERKLLYPDRDRSDIPSALPRSNTDEQFSDRIKSMEQRISSRNGLGSDKKPKDLMRAIGKIDSNDWNIREIEKKIEQSKKTEIYGPKGREKVPKWNKEQFAARQKKMAKPQRQDSNEEKFKEIDQTLKNLDKQLKEGSVLEVGERGRNKVASIAGQFVKGNDISEEKIPASAAGKPQNAKYALALGKTASEKCHFCKQTVYLMEKIPTENLILHRSCLKCHHCHTNLRVGQYAFDRDDPKGRFYCTQHFRLPAKAIRPVVRKSGQRKSTQQQIANAAATSVAGNAALISITDGTGVAGTEVDAQPTTKLRGHADNVAQLDLLDRGQTPERIEFENTDAMTDGEPSEEHIIDEHEWSGRNFLPDAINDPESDLSSSNESGSDSDSALFEEIMNSPIPAAETFLLAADWIGKQNFKDSEDSDDFYDSSDGGADDDGKDESDGEEFKKAREMRREEVRLLPLPANLPTDTETEVQSDSDSTSHGEVERNSATEISTDSEFDHDEIIRKAPKIFIDDTHLRKPTKVQIKSTVIASTPSHKYQTGHTGNTTNHQHHKGGSYLAKYQVNPPQPQFKPLVQVDPSVLNVNRSPLQNPRQGDYLLNKTASTEGIASKKSLELKKRYLLGEPSNGNKIQKSGSTSVLDSRIRSFQSNISECQKLLNPGSDISASMKTFLDRTKLGENTGKDLMRSATSNILNDLKTEMRLQKNSALTSLKTAENEKENLFVNSKNELNKGMEYAETVNAALLDSINRKLPVSPNTNTPRLIETIDLVTPEKKITSALIDLTEMEKPEKLLLETNTNNEQQTILNLASNGSASDSNKIIDLTGDSPIKTEKTFTAEPDVSKDVKACRPDILGHIENGVHSEIQSKIPPSPNIDVNGILMSTSVHEEKRDSPEKLEDQFEHDTVQIQVPNIPWKAKREENISSTTGSTCSSGSSSIEDIQHYILESTTSPDTQTSGVSGHQVPRVEIHDTTGTLMQIDSLMIIDGKYIGDPDDLKYLEIPAGVIVPAEAAIKTSEIDDDTEADFEPITATPEPADYTVIEAEEQPPPLPEQGPPQPAILKFDTKNENKIESLKNLPLIVEQGIEQGKIIKPITLNLTTVEETMETTPTTPTATDLETPTTPLVDNDKTPTGDLVSRGSDSETEFTGTGQVFTETELSDWTADDCISENFLEMEFVLNSNKGTMKRNKRDKKRLNSNMLRNGKDTISEVPTEAPVAEFEGILKAMDMEDIEFMDTGSEGSCAEAYSATNTALLQNRGYIEFIEPPSKRGDIPSSHGYGSSQLQYTGKTITPDSYPKRDERLGVDFIEQGESIRQNDHNGQDLLKTPVNESPKLDLKEVNADKRGYIMSQSVMSQSLTDSSTLNDLDEDSLCVVTTNSQMHPSSVGTTKTNTEESDALTIVTSPIESSSPKTLECLPASGSGGKGSDGCTSTPSSSDKNPKTSQSTGISSGTSSTLSSKATPPRRPSQELSAILGIDNTTPSTMSLRSKPTEEPSCEEYVRALQKQITQISTARNSIDSRKQRRKSSKGDAPIGITQTNAQSVIQSSPINKHQTDTDQKELNTTNTTSQVHKIPEIPTLTRKLEEITKERTKQKDLIHDLVMDKLQSKKQLNAEKRLHRSRQRITLTSGYTSGSSLSPTPKLAAASTTNDTNCTNQAHYHVSTASTTNKENPTSSPPQQQPPVTVNKLEEIPLQRSATYANTYGLSAIATLKNAYKQRPFSEHTDAEQMEEFESYKLNKTPSFSYALNSPTKRIFTTQKSADSSLSYNLSAPVAPIRQNRIRNNGIQGTNKTLAASTENLRCEARARARLKSNSELGLSPEEKMKQLRKRLHIEHMNNGGYNSIKSNISNDVSTREHKMSNSKSVNDLVYITRQQQQQNFSNDVLNNKTSVSTIADFTSDPNLLLSSQADAKQTQSKNSRRQKDPERRKSLIQSLSSFFHKNSSTSNQNGKDKKNQNTVNVTGTTTSSAQSERPAISASTSHHSIASSVDGVFSRFRISPKSKTKDKDGSANNVINYTVTVRANSAQPHERSNSQDCLPKSYTNTNSNSISNRHNHIKKPSSSSSAFSSSSPQLYANRSHFSSGNDEQIPPPIPPLPLNYQRSDDESYATESREQKKQRAISKAVRQAELKRLRIAQEIQREQEEIEVQLKELEARGVLIEKALRGEGQTVDSVEVGSTFGSNDENLLKELLEIWRNITQLKKRDEELDIRQQELQLEHRHAQLKEELNVRLSCNKLDKSSADVAAEGAILNEMLEIVAKRASLRPTTSNIDLTATSDLLATSPPSSAIGVNGSEVCRTGVGSMTDVITLSARGQSLDNDESNI